LGATLASRHEREPDEYEPGSVAMSATLFGFIQLHVRRNCAL
jgi:hypothetical protein